MARTYAVDLPYGPLANFIADLFNHSKIGLIASTADFMKMLAEEMKTYMEDHGKEVYYFLIESTFVSDGQTIQEYYDVRQNGLFPYQYLLLYTTNFIQFQILVKRLEYLKKTVKAIYFVAYETDTRNGMIAAKDLGMLNGDYLFYTYKLENYLQAKTDPSWFRPEIGRELFNVSKKNLLAYLCNQTLIKLAK